ERFSEYHEIVKKVKKDPNLRKDDGSCCDGNQETCGGASRDNVEQTPCALRRFSSAVVARRSVLSRHTSRLTNLTSSPPFHKVFGASNVSKMLLEVGESQRGDAANSLVYEANLRLRDPIYGCMGAISALQHHHSISQSELTTVRTEILRHKYREAATITSLQNNNNNNFNNTTTSVSDHAALAASILLPLHRTASSPTTTKAVVFSASSTAYAPASLPSPSMGCLLRLLIHLLPILYIILLRLRRLDTVILCPVITMFITSIKSEFSYGKA
ncbi:LOW QUALITY PROTEIN: hypothetical protein HID58_091551, partial [Brassica napus]